MTPASDDHAGPERPLSQHAAARVGYALAAADISDYTAAVVPTSGDNLMLPGEFITQARRLRSMAMGMLVRAVLLERAQGHSWKQIAHAYGQTEEWVKGTYEPVELEWLEWLNGAPADGFETVEMAALISDVPTDEPEIRRTAARLDDWCARRRDSDVTPPNLRLVSDGLAG